MKTIKQRQSKPTAVSAYYSKYLDYIKNAGGNPSVEWFDFDWSPIGPMVRREMESAGLVRVIEGKIYTA